MVWQDEDEVEINPLEEDTGRRGRLLLSRGRFFVLGAAIAAALGIVMYIGFRSTAVYYLSVGELLNRGDSAYGEQVRLGGKVMPGTVAQDPVNRTLQFAVMDEEGRSLPVSYQGVVPDAFEEGGDVVLEGKLSQAGLFNADTLLAKCPSKFSSQSEASGNTRP